MKDGLAVIGLLVLTQYAWMKWCMWQAANDDVTLGGAYCAMWMFGIPLVTVISVIAYLVVPWLISLFIKKPAPPKTSDL